MNAASHDNDQHIAELATGFALGELEEAELRELYEALREPGDDGARAARIAWQVLGTTVDLRASIGTKLQDTVKHRIDHRDDEVVVGSGGFVGSILRAIGVSRKQLIDISVPDMPVHKGPPWLLMLGMLALGMGIAWALLGENEVDGLATVTMVSGGVTREGSFLDDGESVDQRPIILASGSHLTLSWRDEAGQATVQFDGPAKVLPQPNGCSLLSGRAWVSTTIPFRIGLPERKAELIGGSSVAVQIDENRSQLGVKQGLVRYGNDDALRELGPGRMLGPHGTTATWINTLIDLASSDFIITTDAAAETWTLSATVKLNAITDGVQFNCEANRALRFAADATYVIGDQQTKRIAWNGPPLGEREFTLSRDATRTTLMISGEEHVVDLPNLPAVVAFTGNAKISNLAHHTGPEWPDALPQ